ncbi:MAG: hypothetical protein V3S64_00120 [bacterium]
MGTSWTKDAPEVKSLFKGMSGPPFPGHPLGFGDLEGIVQTPPFREYRWENQGRKTAVRKKEFGRDFSISRELF